MTAAGWPLSRSGEELVEQHIKVLPRLHCDVAANSIRPDM